MNEATAKTKWCPYAFVRGRDAPACNRNTGREEETRCLGTGCMAWRGTVSDGYCGVAGSKDPP